MVRTTRRRKAGKHFRDSPALTDQLLAVGNRRYRAADVGRPITLGAAVPFRSGIAGSASWPIGAASVQRPARRRAVYQFYLRGTSVGADSE